LSRLTNQERGRRGYEPRRIVLRSTGALNHIGDYLTALVHPSARTDQLALVRHRGFIATRLLGGLGAIAVLPAHLAVLGAPTLLQTIGYAWFLLPLTIAWYLSRSGNFERAHIFSAVTFSGIVGLIASLTGGGYSFALPWLVVIPVEAALYSTRRITIIATALAAITAVAIAAGDALGLFSSSAVAFGLVSPVLFSSLSAALYCGFVAVGADAIPTHKASTAVLDDAHYRIIAENTRELVTSHGRNGAVTFASQAAEQLLGVPPAKLMGHNFFDRIHVADRPVFLTAIAETAANAQPLAVEYRLRHGPFENQDGLPAAPSFIWVETCCRVAAPGSNNQQVIATTSEISQRKMDEIALGQARVDAKRASDAKGRFLATVSHELRTPLNAIIGFSEMLTREKSMMIDTKQREDYARLIRDSGEHLLALVNGILDVSQIETGNFTLAPKSFAVGELIEGCCEMMTLHAERVGISLSIDLAPGLPEIVADKRAIRQILLNLLSNAIKFSNRGGKVVVSCTSERSELILKVADSGIGIAESDLKQIGSPFFQVRSSYDRPYEGTGLGLSVVKGLVDLHGGHFHVESRIGVGTQVTIRLPLDGGDISVPVSTPTIERLPVKNSERERMKRRA
jgi:cell cycle sensor histidine kinase DivJ